MSKKERAEYPPSSNSARYHRSSLPHKGAGLGSSSTKVQVVGDNSYGPERGYDSEAVRHDGAPPVVAAGYHTEGVPSTGKRASKDLYRSTLDRRAHGVRLSSMPAASQPPSFGYPYDQPGPDPDDSAAENSLRRVKKDRDSRDSRRHRDRERDAQYTDRPDGRAVPADVWMQQVTEPKSSRSGKRESRSARRQDETPLPPQPELPRTYPQQTSAQVDYQKHAHSQQPYAYPQQQPSSSVPYRSVNATPVPPHQDHYRPNPPVVAPPDNYAALVSPTPDNQAQIKPRYEYVIDDRAGMRSPPPIEIPHAVPYDHYSQPESPALPLPRSLAQLKADGLIPSSPAPTHRRTHRPGARSEDVNPAGGFFADGSPSGPYGSHAEHARPSLRHRPSRSELGLGQVVPGDQLEALVRPVHVGRSASETIVPQAQQLPTAGMFGAGLAVTSARGVPAPGGMVMHPQLQESFAESADASRAPVNAAMANAAIHGYSGGIPDSDSSSAKDKEASSRRTMKKEKKPRRTSRQSEVVPPLISQADLAYPEPNRQTQAEAVRQLIIEPSPPPVVVPYPSGRRPRTTSGRSAGVVQDEEQEPEPDTVVYQTPEPGEMNGARRASRSSLSAPRGDALLGSRQDMTFAGAGAALGAPRGDGGYESRAAGVEVSARRGSVVDDERTRRPSAGAEDRSRWPPVGAEDRSRRPSIETRKIEEVPGRKSLGLESDSSFQSYESAVLAGSTTATHDAQDFSSAKDAMSPRSNYYSVAASVRSMVNEVRSVANEARNIANEAREMGATNVVVQSQSGLKTTGMPAPPLTQPRQGGARTSSAPSIINGLPALSKSLSSKPSGPVPPTPIVRPGDAVSPQDMHARPRAPSGSLPAPPLVPDAPHRATVDAHVRDNAPQPMMVDEEGRLTRAPAVSQTMPTRAPRHSLTRQGPPPMGIVTPVASPPYNHADAQASALPKNLQSQQQQQPIGSSKESLVEQNGKSSGKNKSSRWFWSKSKPAEAGPSVRAQTSSPAPPSVNSPPTQRVRHPSLLNSLMMGAPVSKSSKSTQRAPEPPSSAPPAPRLSNEFYQSMDSTPSSITLEVEPEPVRKDESRVPRMFATIKNSLRRTPSSSKIGHSFSRSMSRLPGTREAATVAAPPPGAPLARSMSAKDSAWLKSPQRSSKEPLRTMKDGTDVPPPPPPPVIPPAVPAPLPPAPVAAPPPPSILPPAPTPAPAVAIPKSQKPSPPEAMPVKDDRRPFGKDVPIVDKGRSPAPTSSRAPGPVDIPSKSSRTLVDANGRSVDANGRLVESSSRTPIEGGSRSAGQRTSVQAAPPPHPRAASPPLVSRPVAATRVPVNGQSNIFGSNPSRSSNQPNPVPVSSSRTSRGSRQSRDPDTGPGPAHGSLRTPRPREAVPMPAPVPEPAGSVPELGLPTPDDTPRSSPTGGAMFDSNKPGSASAPPKEKSRPANIVIPKQDLALVNQKLAVDPHLKFDHRQKRAVSIASLEAVTGQEAHFRSEASSIRTVTPGPGQTSFPLRDPLSAAHDWTALQLHEDKLAARRDSITRRLQEEAASGKRYRGGLKRNKGGTRKPGVAFDFPGPVIDEDGEEKEDSRQLDIERTYELERIHKRYK